MRYLISTICFLSLALGILSCRHHGAVAKPAGIEPLPGLEHGLCQSPIDIRPGISGAHHHQIEVHYETSHEVVRNTGHSVRLDYDPGSSIEFDGLTYALKQFHFHTPSEHLIAGKRFPMEAHLVHERPGPAGEPTQYLVVAVLFQAGASHAFLDAFLDDIPASAHKANMPLRKTIDLGRLFYPMRDAQHYYAYRGSLTTPPYTETVQWVVLQERLSASVEQIEKIHRLEGDNARPVQPLHERQVDTE